MNSKRLLFNTLTISLLFALTILLSSINIFAQTTKKATPLFRIGIAGYTFKDLSVEQSIELMKKVGVTNLSIKDMQLPLTSTQQEIDAVKAKFAAGGITLYTVGVIYMKTKEQVDVAFDYAKKVGVNLIVCAPNYELLGYVEQKVKETNIRTAIHNHGPDNPLYPNATDTWNHIKNMDARMGICIDIGHTQRDGQDPSIDLERYKSRIFDIHIKDVSAASKQGSTVEMGRGVIDLPKFVRTLKKIKYSGVCSLEFEKDSKDPLAGVAESIGYLKGIIACTE
jgi:sugar phosphate isomerase/epimerase